MVLVSGSGLSAFDTRTDGSRCVNPPHLFDLVLAGGLLVDVPSIDD